MFLSWWITSFVYMHRARRTASHSTIYDDRMVFLTVHVYCLFYLFFNDQPTGCYTWQLILYSDVSQ